MEECLRFYGAMQGDDGFIRWISPSLVAFDGREQHALLGRSGLAALRLDRRPAVRPRPLAAVRKAVAWQRERNDPDGDGLFRDSYEYLELRLQRQGPEGGRAQRHGVGDARSGRPAGRRRRRRGGRKGLPRPWPKGRGSRSSRELWREDEGRLGSIGQDGIWRGHPQTWEEYLAINAGLLSPDQGRRAMRWVASHYGFEPQPGVHLLLVQRLVARSAGACNGCPPATPAWPPWPG